MNELIAWSEQNEKFLSAALTWLRLRLKAQINQVSNPQPRSVQTALVKSSGNLFTWLRPERTKPVEEAVETVVETVSQSEVTRAASAMAAAQAADPPPALAILANRFGLSPFEQNVLLLCAAMELDTSISILCARAQDDPNRPYPTFALALTLFDEPTWDVLSPERPLRHWQLIGINQSGAQVLTTSPLHADERIVNYLKGLNYLDDRLTPFLFPLEVETKRDSLPPSHQTVVESIVGHLEKEKDDQPVPLIQLLGPDSPSKQIIAQHAAAAFGLYLYRLPVELIPAQVAELETLIRLWERESRLLPVAIYLEAKDTGAAPLSAEQAQAINRFLARSNALFFFDSREVWSGLSRHSLNIDIARPTALEQQAAWKVVLGSSAGDWPDRLAGQFNLNIVAMERIARTTNAVYSQNGHSLPDQLWQACLSSTRPQLDVLAQRIEVMATWDDIVLPDDEVALLRQIAAQVRQRSRVYDTWGFRQKMNRGLGISVLFAGESGTGKTMAAEVIANHLRLNLYRIDLSGVVSKYIGETEKNLRRLFDAAEDGGAILFFDEADALFGKRSEVKDSHDRYANIEINYLLQRIEAYRGLAILATNMKKALDQAFTRRLRFTVNFPFPGPEERKLIWQKVFPPEMPTADLDFDRLTRLNLTGGSIHNIALNAAFLAAHAGTPVTMPFILSAARTEFRKLERPVNEADFRWQAPTEVVV